MEILRIDHLVLAVADVDRARAFYAELLGLEAREERPGKWSLHFGAQKISLQGAADVPAIARGSVPGSGNFCLVVHEPVEAVAAQLRAHGVEILLGPVERSGALGPIRSIYLHDPDGNLVELCNPL